MAPSRRRASELVERGNAAFDRGDLEAALLAYREAIQSDPAFGTAHRCLGIALLAQGEAAAGIAAHRQAIALDPADAASHCNLGFALLDTGDAKAAEAAFRAALSARPEFPEAWVGLAEGLGSAGRETEALEALDKAIALRSQYVGALLNAAALLRKTGKTAEADARLRSIDLPALLQARRLDEAEWAARELTQALPDEVTAWRILGAVRSARGEHGAAADAFRRAAELEPGDTETHHNLALCLQSLGHHAQAEQAFQYALQARPDYPEAHDNLANVLFAQGRVDEAEAACRRALALRPRFAEAHSDLGRILDAKGRAHESIESYRTALDIDATSAKIHNNFAAALVSLGRLDEAEASCRRALALDPLFTAAHDNLLSIVNYQPDKTPEEAFADYREYDRRIGAPLRATWQPHANERRADRRLRVGYVSPDFRKHAVSNFAEPLFDHHDRSRFEVFAYSGVVAEDEVTARFKAKADRWVSTVGLDDAELAERIRADGIDVLVDLSGHTKGNRLTTFARKPAPLSATAIGAACTTGLSAIDGLLTDARVVPAGTENTFSEQPWRLPIYQVYRPGPGMGEPNELPALANGHVTFGTLTRAARLNHRVIALWSEVLRRLPDARLRIDSLNFRDPGACNEIAGKFMAHGIARERLDIGFHSPPWDKLRTFDLSLDGFPQNSGTTLFDSLYLGVPFVTLRDRPALGRLGDSIASAAGHPEWVASSASEYVEIAVRLASDLPGLAALRKSLRGTMRSSPLMDEKGYVRAVESVYCEMWARWCASR